MASEILIFNDLWFPSRYEAGDDFLRMILIKNGVYQLTTALDIKFSTFLRVS